MRLSWSEVMVNSRGFGNRRVLRGESGLVLQLAGQKRLAGPRGSA